MLMFVLVVVTMLAGQLVHILVDRSPLRRTPARRRELGLLWVVGGTGFWVLVDGLLYLSPSSITVTSPPGDAPALVHWELAWADITLGLLLLGCLLHRNRGSWMNAAVLALTVLNTADAVGNMIQIFGPHDYTAVHIWAIPTELVQVVLALGHLAAYRRWTTHAVLVRPPDGRAQEPPSRPAPPQRLRRFT